MANLAILQPREDPLDPLRVPCYALRANLVRRVVAWRWGSLYRRRDGAPDDKLALAAWSVPRKASWFDYVNAPQTEAELATIRRTVERRRPFGDEAWTKRALELESTIRSLRAAAEATAIAKTAGFGFRHCFQRP